MTKINSILTSVVQKLIFANSVMIKKVIKKVCHNGKPFFILEKIRNLSSKYTKVKECTDSIFCKEILLSNR